LDRTDSRSFGDIACGYRRAAIAPTASDEVDNVRETPKRNARSKSVNVKLPMPYVGSDVMFVVKIAPIGVLIRNPPVKGGRPATVWQAAQSPSLARYSPRAMSDGVASDAARDLSPAAWSKMIDIATTPRNPAAPPITTILPRSFQLMTEPMDLVI
jgi:hypothetical protein